MTGERKEKTEWHRVVIFNENLVKLAKSYLKKGSKVFVEGSLQTRKWTDQAGAEKYTTEIVLQNFNGNITMLDGKSGGGSDDRGNDNYNDRAPAMAAASAGAQLDDEIPF